MRELQFSVFIKSDGGTAVQLATFIKGEFPLARNLFNLLHVLNDDLQLAISVAELKQALENDPLEC
jgi:hypothetical protein